MTKNNTINSELVHKSHRPALKIVDNQTLPDFVLNHRIKVDNLNYPCFTDALTKESMTYEELHSIVPRLASGLHNNFGIVKDDIVSMFVPNHINFGAAMLGITDIGARISPVNYVYTPNELANLLKLVQPKVLFTVPELLEISQKALEHPELVNVKLAFLTNEGTPQFPDIPNFKQILSDKPYPKLKLTNTEDSKKQVAAILFSSGTTGIPKGVMLSHFNLIANMQQFENVLDPYFQPRATFVTVLPFYHLYAMMTDLLLVMHSACSTNVMKKFDFQTYLEIIDKNEIKLNFVAPPIIVQLAKNPIVKNYNIRNLKAFFCAAAPLSKELEDDIFSKFGIKITQGYGMSELSPISHCNDVHEKRAGAAGYMVANMEQIVVDVATGKRVGPNKRGELRLKGPNVMMGYYKNPQVTKDMFDEEGFMKTGDIVYVDDDGYIYIVDRLKELIKVKGLQVAPAELEAVLLTHPDVADACVIGVSNPVAGELPRGYITLKNPNAPNKPEIVKSIHKYFGEQLAHYKQLKGGVEIIPEIPKSPSGKILRRKLRDLGNAGKPKL